MPQWRPFPTPPGSSSRTPSAPRRGSASLAVKSLAALALHFARRGEPRSQRGRDRAVPHSHALCAAKGIHLRRSLGARWSLLRRKARLQFQTSTAVHRQPRGPIGPPARRPGSASLQPPECRATRSDSEQLGATRIDSLQPPECERNIDRDPVILPSRI